MPDVVTTPQILEPNEVMIYGLIYRVRGLIEVGLSTQFPAKLVIGDYGRDDNPLISTYSVSDLRGGMGLWRYTDYAKERDRYWTGQNFDGAWLNAATLGPLISDGGLPTGVTSRISAISILKTGVDGVVVAFNVLNQSIYNFSPSNAWSALRGSLAIGICPPSTQFGSRLVFPSGNGGTNGYAYQTDTSTFVNVPVAGNLDAISFAEWDSKLYALNIAGTLFVSTTGDAGSWTAKAAVPVPLETGTVFGNRRPLVLRVYDDISGDPVLWALSQVGPYIYDAVNDKWFRQRFMIPRFVTTEDYYNGGMGTVFRGDLYLNAGGRKLYRLGMGGNEVIVDDVTIGLPDGLASAYQTDLKEVVANDRFLFGLYSPAAPTVGGTMLLALRTGRAWHPIGAMTTDLGDLARAAIVDDGVNRRLYFEGPGATNQTLQALRYIDLALLEENPLLSTAKTFAASGNVELPVFNGGYEEQQKTALSVRVKLNGASATETVQIAYRLDGSTGGYTNLGSAVNSDTETVIRFGANSQGLAFKSIQFRLTFARGATTTAAPKLVYFALDFLRIPEALRGFVVQVDCNEDSPDGRTPREQIDDLWTAVGTATLGTLSYRDDVNNTRSYLVRVLPRQGQENTGPDERGIYTLYCPEFNG